MRLSRSTCLTFLLVVGGVAMTGMIVAIMTDFFWPKRFEWTYQVAPICLVIAVAAVSILSWIPDKSDEPDKDPAYPQASTPGDEDVSRIPGPRWGELPPDFFDSNVVADPQGFRQSSDGEDLRADGVLERAEPDSLEARYGIDNSGLEYDPDRYHRSQPWTDGWRCDTSFGGGGEHRGERPVEDHPGERKPVQP